MWYTINKGTITKIIHTNCRIDEMSQTIFLLKYAPIINLLRQIALAFRLCLIGQANVALKAVIGIKMKVRLAHSRTAHITFFLQIHLVGVVVVPCFVHLLHCTLRLTKAFFSRHLRFL